jgi:transcriptional regulator with XRE-family HTH domain
MAKKQPDSLDIKVGSKVRALRLERQMSQEKLGDALGLTFQQVQKYEKGTNRISAGRLQRIAAILEVPVSVFFADANPPAGGAESLFDLVDTGSALRLLRAYSRIPSPALKLALTTLAEEIAGRSR